MKARSSLNIVPWCLLHLLAALGLLLPTAAAAGLLPEPIAAIPQAVEDAIRAGETPGAVVLVAQDGDAVFRQAFGYRRLGSDPAPMTLDTIFDVASLTKVVATTTAVMQLVESGRMSLDEPASRYWGEFKGGGKERITIRQLLTHYSGLRPGLLPKPAWSGYRAALDRIIRDTLPRPPGTSFNYSDLNFVVLAEVVRRVTREPIDLYAPKRVFEPLGMQDTGYAPGPGLRGRLAPTMEGSRGVVHDPNTRRMGGVSGAAGLFATADDLGRFAQALLDGGGPVLKPATVQEMTTPQSPPGKLPARGLGWAISSPPGNWSEMLPPGSFGHKGYTGTMLWIDPATRTYLVVLSSRVYPDGEPHGDSLRDAVFRLVVEATGRPKPAAPSVAAAARPAPASGFLAGVDVLAGERFAPLWGKRVAIVTNHTGLDGSGRRTIDLLHRAPGVKLEAIFTPEHGLTGKVDAKVGNSRDPGTGLPVYSLYGESLRPKPEQLKGLEVLVFDVQDAGARFYTYMSTMGLSMAAAARQGIEFLVLDRPNPITARAVSGPVLDADLKGFTGYFPMPVRHGMTLGELARMFNAENAVGANLQVVPMAGYRRDMWFDETGRPWVNPSPNLRSLNQTILYPGVALSEAANVSVGRGTATPFEVIGAPWIEAERLADYLGGREIPGVEFAPVRFTPEGGPYKGQVCQGVKMRVVDRNRLDSVGMGVEILSALHRLYPNVFLIDRAIGLLGSRAAVQALKDGEDPRAVAAGWQPSLEEFMRVREKYLMY
jgi:uncharacterized protein YbbC (DUF1343 family)/CubicO group peptidase (beta-lactamase class C family)